MLSSDWKITNVINKDYIDFFFRFNYLIENCQTKELLKYLTRYL